MSDQPQLPGYSVDDDTQDNNDHARHIDVVTRTTHSEGAGDDPVSSASVGDAVPTYTATASSPTRQDSTRPRSTPPDQHEAGEEEHPTATTIFAAPLTTPPLPIDEFADPKISALHTIFPDYDAAIL
jgi:hypothetical protein